MASTSRACKTKESEILQILEESTDSDMSSICFSSEEDRSDSDSDNQGNGGEILDEGHAGTVETNITGTWSHSIRYQGLQKHDNLTGPNHDLPFGSTEQDFFDLFVGSEFYELVAEQTNIHAEYLQRKAGTNDTNWEDTHADEIRAYIGILIYMGLVDLPEIDDYFLGDFCVCSIVRQAMTLKRFRKLGQYLHLNNQENRPGPQDENFDILYKARPVLQLTEKFKILYTPGPELAVDEAMIGFKGRFFLKQYLPGKPTKWGIKAWGIADSGNGYLLKCDIYKGKKETRDQELLLGEQVVLHLTEPYWGKWHHIYFDNFFSSVKLMKLLLTHNTYSCGTTRSNRKGWPTQFRNPAQMKLKRGECRKMQNEDIVATVWQDKRSVLMLSTNSDPVNDGRVTRKIGRGNEEIEIPCPNAVINYTKYMGGVDISDQKREYYGVGRSSKKWWKFIFHFVLNVCIVNSFILYDLNNRPTLTSHGNRQLTFRRNLVQQLIGNFSSRKRTGRKRSLPIGTASPKFFHSLIKIPGRAKVCAVCMQKKKKAASGRGKQTTFKCKQCDLPLCRTGCFLEYHQERNVEIKN